jgi:hypothetical protein
MARASLLSTESWQRMCAPTRLSNGELSGYGCGLENRLIHGTPVIDHDGGISGFASYSARVADSGLLVCVLSNNDSADPSPIDVGERIVQTVTAFDSRAQSRHRRRKKGRGTRQLRGQPTSKPYRAPHLLPPPNQANSTPLPMRPMAISVVTVRGADVSANE